MRFRHLLIAGTMLAITTPAFAWDYNQYGNGQQIGDNATGVQNNLSARASAAAAASSSASSASRSGSVATQRQGQSTTVSGAGAGAASNAGNSQTVNVGGGGNGGHNDRFPVSSAYAPSFGSVNPCAGGAISGGIQLFGIGASGGGSVHFDQMCQIAQYSSNPYAFQWACTEMDGFRSAAREAYRAGFAPHPCAQDVVLVVAEPPRPILVAEPAPVKRWAVVPCHMPFVRDAHGRCYNPTPPRPRPVAPPAPCVDEVVHVCKPVKP